MDIMDTMMCIDTCIYRYLYISPGKSYSCTAKNARTCVSRYGEVKKGIEALLALQSLELSPYM